MKKYINLLLVSAIIILLVSCNSEEKKLKQRWIIGQILAPENPWKVDSTYGACFTQLNKIYRRIQSNSFIWFQDDNKYNMRFGSVYAEGTYIINFEKKIIELKPNFGNIKPDLVEFTDNTLKMNFRMESDTALGKGADYFNRVEFECIKDTVEYSDEEKTPFSFEANAWAVPPTKKLDDREIKRRLINYIDFMILLLNDERNNSVTLETFDSPISVNKLNVELYAKDDFLKCWNNIYSDKENLNRAFTWLSRIFKFKMEHLKSKNFVERNTHILKQARGYINNQLVQ